MEFSSSSKGRVESFKSGYLFASFIKVWKSLLALRRIFSILGVGCSYSSCCVLMSRDFLILSICPLNIFN